MRALEEALIDAFIVPTKRERYRTKLAERFAADGGWRNHEPPRLRPGR